MKGDCNICANGKLTVTSRTCVECGLSRKNYKPLTNADRIRGMSDEELARWIALHPCLPNCPAQTEECFKSSKLEICAKRWLNYLKEEATDA